MQVLMLKAQPRSLLVPVSMVAQILGHEEEDVYSHDLPFISSAILWRELRIPLIHSSHMLGAAPGSDRDYERIVVLWPMEGTHNTDLFGLTSMDSPKVVTIGAESGQSEVIEASNEGADNEYVLGRAELEGAEGTILNLPALARDIFSR